ncbi:hypothetical protein K458DRAFT_7827 [Lentithecium fluviatile CBS 122367]|uniref:Uncharacterized protein n=1 Tax=Lentithecium fluviatile CBS 122367 TaxID=1168545 RepID=A0A6G1JP50_9PLEO|nr:hypothetical protein K458DRAFT_7827 [Lentithecium fluviatile CBS 122367]
MSDPMPIKKGFEATRGILQELVVVVSLVRTLASSFVSAGHVYRRLKKRSKDVKGHIKDHLEEDQGREKGKEKHEEHDRRSRRDSHSDDDQGRRRLSHRRWESRSRSRRRRDDSTDSEAESIDTSAALVRTEYDRGYQILGERFANGDLITRNQLQYQIIALQQALLQIYENSILYSENPRHPPSFYLRQLVQTARSARQASIEALSMQYNRMLPAPEVHEPHAALPGPRSSSSTIYSSHHDSPHPDASSHAYKPTSGELFCVFARDLQRSPTLPLSDNFKSGGDHRCPYCHAYIPVRHNKAWEIVKEVERVADKEICERTFLVNTRFLVKCHRQGGGFACVLCCEYSDADTVCSEVRALIEHLWREHTCAELEWDGDIAEEE